MINQSQLEQLGAKSIDALKYVDSLNSTLIKYDITTNARISQFLAQIYVESQSLSKVKESLYYSAKRLCIVWPSRFPTLASAIPYEKNPAALAEKVYGGRMGNTAPGDGAKYIGRGLKQLTGKDNYRSVSKSLGVDFLASPELLEEPEFACLSAGFFWNAIKANSIDDIDNEAAVKTITRLINGGYNGLNERIEFWKKAKEIWK